MKVFYQPACARYAYPGHVECPARVVASAQHLQESALNVHWAEPEPADERMILRAHAPGLVALVEREVPVDADTPSHPGMAMYARSSAGAAVEVARHALSGQPAFSLMRPPGHHATRREAMGFCYFNSVAIAVLDAIACGVRRVGVWDFDAHHGNGTEDILHGVDGALFVSVHQSPGYPGSGRVSRGNCRNFPVAPGTPAGDHLAVLAEAWRVLQEFDPGLVLVSAGFDAYVHDPITTMTLEASDFATLGGWLRDSACPVGAVLEGGYSTDLPVLIASFLRQWDGDKREHVSV